MRRGSLIGLVAATITVWGFVFIPLKYLTNSGFTDHPLPPEGFLVLRFLPLLPVYLIMMFRYGIKENRATILKNWPWFAAMGFLAIPGYHLPLNLALRTPLHTGLISLLLALSPAMTYFLAVAFRQERFRRERTMGVVLAFLGIALIFGEELLRDLPEGFSDVFSWEGVGWMFLSSLAWSLANLVGRRLGRDHDSRFSFATSGTMGTLVVLAAAPFTLTGEIWEVLPLLGAPGIAAWAYVTLLATLFAYWAWMAALRQLEASRLAITVNALPLVVHAAAVIFLPEERKAFTPIYILGAAITVIGIGLVIRRREGR